ncbi:glycosyltransferase [Novosphingobium sp.]|uniref:glycosyltransferase n=1 Tax=Novosphingobium sp. TaxID=1874826 RepID=UPI00286E63EA|nr:glycosyltransferase [Novosphingobium sp.]
MAALDDMAKRIGRPILAQTADPVFTPHTIQAVDFLRGAEFEDAMAGARLIVAHAGIGAIMAAAHLRKPIILMPRRADLGEHRNDHQIATARRFAGVPGITVVQSPEELESAIRASDYQPVTIGDQARLGTLIEAISQAIG